MAGIDKKLTDLTELSNPTDNAWIHIVEPTDISQSPEGSSYKVKKTNFGGLSDAPSDGETYGRKDGAWEVVGGGEVLTTNTNITSAVLSTQDVAGFVAYINGLVSSFSVAVNEIRTYTVTNTGQKFQLLLRGRSFGGAEPDIVAADVLELEPAVTRRRHFIHFTGFVDFPADNNYYGPRIVGPQYGGWYRGDVSVLSGSVGASPVVDSRAAAQLIPFKCKISSINARINMTNFPTVTRDLRLFFYKHEPNNTSPVTNQITVAELSTAGFAMANNKTLQPSDITIPNVTLNAGDAFTFLGKNFMGVPVASSTNWDIIINFIEEY